MRSVPPELLTPDFLDEIKARALFVSEPISLRDSELDEGGGLADLLGTPAAVPPTPGQTSDSPSRAVAAPVSESEDVRMSDIGEGASISDEAADGELMRQLKRRYAASSTATDLAIRVPPAKEATSASGNGPGNAPSTGRGAIAIPGWVRERAAEVLFEEGDIDEASIVELVLDALKSVSRRHAPQDVHFVPIRQHWLTFFDALRCFALLSRVPHSYPSTSANRWLPTSSSQAVQPCSPVSSLACGPKSSERWTVKAKNQKRQRPHPVRVNNHFHLILPRRRVRPRVRGPPQELTHQELALQVPHYSPPEAHSHLAGPASLISRHTSQS